MAGFIIIIIMLPINVYGRVDAQGATYFVIPMPGLGSDSGKFLCNRLVQAMAVLLAACVAALMSQASRSLINAFLGYISQQPIKAIC
jgi:hypothetical protein